VRPPLPQPGNGPSETVRITADCESAVDVAVALRQRAGKGRPQLHIRRVIGGGALTQRHERLVALLSQPQHPATPQPLA